MLVIGQPINIKKLLHYTGVDQQTGIYSFQDKNKDDQISIDFTGQTVDDRRVYNLNPKYDGGFTNTFRYKNWQLSMFVYFKKQIGLNALTGLDAPGDFTNQPTSVLSRWQKPGDITTVAHFTTNPYTDNSFTNYQQYSDAVYTDASFIRLQNVSLSYSLPEKNIKKIGLTDCRAYLQGQNLLTITKYNGLDPEIQYFTSLPLARIITAGISFSF
jgi:hypothetical protein